LEGFKFFTGAYFRRNYRIGIGFGKEELFTFLRELAFFFQKLQKKVAKFDFLIPLCYMFVKHLN